MSEGNEGTPRLSKNPNGFRETITFLMTNQGLSEKDARDKVAETLHNPIVRGLIREQRRKTDLDPLTDVKSRGWMLGHNGEPGALERYYDRAVKGGSDLAAIAIDIDHFKKTNDRFGHDVGDEVLKAVATALNHGLRIGDVIARVGGEEFLILIPDADKMTDVDYFNLVNRIRASVLTCVPARVLNSTRGEVIKPTVSMGIATVKTTKGVADGKDLMKQADTALYRAKNSGRDCAFRDDHGTMVPIESPKPTPTIK